MGLRYSTISDATKGLIDELDLTLTTDLENIMGDWHDSLRAGDKPSENEAAEHAFELWDELKKTLEELR